MTVDRRGAFSRAARGTIRAVREGSGDRATGLAADMSKRLYVGNLAFHSTEDNLRNAFETAGVEVLSIQLMTDRMTGQSRGFGFVEVSDAQAQAAINALHGKDLDGRTLTVNEARERTGGPGGGGGGGGGGFRGGGGGGRGGGGGGRGGRGGGGRDRW
ncbi:RNA-binding protein [Sorangium sp. So ce834]|uniref:RNA recognition motif domain-containing protein n=1 Tax=Sorangium sp. So ce834 TaxID=3133321 RepID=UPI003F5DF003